jgi:hypothetical protein
MFWQGGGERYARIGRGAGDVKPSLLPLALVVALLLAVLLLGTLAAGGGWLKLALAGDIALALALYGVGLSQN